MSGVLKQILDSKKTVMERFKKLYRTLYIQFINKDTMHKKDLQKIIEQLNLRISTLETNINIGFKAIDAAIPIALVAHTHTVTSPGSPSGPGIPVSAAAPTPPSITTGLEATINSLSKTEAQLNARIGELAGQGPSTAPYADGFDPAIVNANVTGSREILVGEGPGL